MQAEIKGTTMPTLQVSLEQGEYLVSTHGELAWMTASIRMSQGMSPGGPGGPASGTGPFGDGGIGGGGGRGGFMQGLKRMVGGGGLFLTRYEGPGAITFAAKVPGHITPVDIEPGQAHYVHRHGFLCGTAGITPSVGLQQTFRGGMFGGDGFILQKLEGQGRAWIELSGELTSYELPPGQTLMVHPGHVGMFAGTVQFQVVRMPGIANMFFGDDGFHVVALTGPGRVWLQSMPLQVLAQALSEYIRRDDRDTTVQSGGVGGIIGDMLRGS
jgi:uncharacterized protein (AIM24 family)